MFKKSVISALIILGITLSVFIIPFDKASLYDATPASKNLPYSYKIPEGYKYNEMFYPVNLRYEGKDTVIEIYQEELSGDAQMSYINYTNKPIIENSVDYADVDYFTKDNMHVLSWKREKLSKIENDKNHYLKIDFTASGLVNTMIVKSSLPIDDYEQYVCRGEIVPVQNTSNASYEIKKPSMRTFNEETQRLYDSTFLNSDKLSWGIFHPEYTLTDSLERLETDIEHKFDFVLWYKGFAKEYIPNEFEGFLKKAYNDGRIVEMTLQPQLIHDPGNDIFKLLNGEYDSFLDSFAKGVADFSHPVLLRICNEMNGDWCEYSAYRMSLDTELYREMYKYIYSFFEKHNAQNVIWIWNPNGKSFPNYKWNSEDMYYPGNEFVDVLGLTLYNTGTYYEGETWDEFWDLYAPLYEASMQKYDMPFMITEFACSGVGGDKEEWTRKMLTEIQGLENIKLAFWWNNADYDADGNISRPYYIDDSDEMKTIFKEYFSDTKSN